MEDNKCITHGNQIKVNGVWFINRDMFVEKLKEEMPYERKVIDKLAGDL